ncbi:MAG TPA: glycosyltransferase family 39 protein [Nitrospirota bacterium]|nr:glycosyltransferase family 39 protein [Nitrospirota bacterium]
MDIGKIEQALLLSFCMLIVVPLLFIFRSFDHNTFTNWQWVFSGPGMARVFLLIVPAIFCAYGVARLSLAGPRAIAFLFVLSLAAVLPLWSGPESVIDASRYFIQAKAMKEYGISYFFKEWGRSIPAWTDLPLVPFLYGLLFSRAGEARAVIQAINSVLFALTAVLTFLIGKKLWDEDTGFRAGLLLLGVPYLLVQAPLLLVDVPTMFFLTLSVFAFLVAIERGGFARTAAAALVICAAFFSKYSTWPMLALIPVIAAVRPGSDAKKTWIRTCAVLGMSLALAGLVIALRLDFFREQFHLLWTYQRPGLGRWHEGFVSAFFFQTHPFIAGLALFGTYQAVRKTDKNFLIPAWFFVITILLRIDRVRYLIPLLPLFVLMASYGLGAVRDGAARRFICLSIAGTSMVVAWGAYLPFLAGTSPANLAEAGAFLNGLGCSPVEVYALPQKSSTGSTFAAIPLLDYFTDAAFVSPQDWPVLPEDSARQVSSLRFTWEMRKPAYYAKRVAENSCAVVLLSDEILDRPPPAYKGWSVKRFDLQSPMFKYQTIVTVLTRQ